VHIAARHVPTRIDRDGGLLPPISQARNIGRFIAAAVGKQAIEEGQSQLPDEDALDRELQANTWEPVYVPYERKL
jgi:malate dehydrogenase (oxaloacetate-decarboxylating)